MKALLKGLPNDWRIVLVDRNRSVPVQKTLKVKLILVLQVTSIVRQTRASWLKNTYTFDSRPVRVSAIHSRIGTRAQSVYVKKPLLPVLPLTLLQLFPTRGSSHKTQI